MEKLTRKEQKERTRLGLIDMAEELFARKGIAATTTADIAAALKVSHGTLFIHFPTREELVLAAVDPFGERLSEALKHNMNDEMPLEDLLRAHLEVLAEHEDFYLRLISESQSLPTQIRSQVYALNSALSYMFIGAARPLMGNGTLKNFAQAPFFNAWMALVHFHIMNRDLFADQKPILKAIGEDILQQFYQLIKKEQK